MYKIIVLGIVAGVMYYVADVLYAGIKLNVFNSNGLNNAIFHFLHRFSLLV
jgi:hypothetical protein